MYLEVLNKILPTHIILHLLNEIVNCHLSDHSNNWFSLLCSDLTLQAVLRYSILIVTKRIAHTKSKFVEYKNGEGDWKHFLRVMDGQSTQCRFCLPKKMINIALRNSGELIISAC